MSNTKNTFIKKFLKWFIIISIFINVWIVYAHPLDISISTASIRWNNVNITTYLHTFEVDYLLKNNWITVWWVNDYYENSDIITNYINRTAILKNNWDICELSNIKLIDNEPYEILSDWLWVKYQFTCKANIEKLYLKLGFFTEFPLQTNRITLFDLNKWIKWAKAIWYKVLTSKIDNLEIDLNNLNTTSIDSDNDWLSDEEEKIYNTDPNKIDTDWDNYTDKEEIDYGFDPINKELVPWQEYREEISVKVSKNKIDNLTILDWEIKSQNLGDYWYWNDYLKSTMKYINDYFSKNEWNILYIFLIIFILGVLHAIWPWHWKSLLISYTIEEDNWYKKGLLFSLIFSITHIVDIVVLFIITKVIIHFVDPSKYSYYIQIISWIILLLLSIYLIYKALYIKKSCSKKKTNTVFIAFIAWLAPCSFAWSIFILLFSIGKTTWIIPLIFALWLWIFTTLSVIVIISIFLKNRIYSKITKIAKYSSLLSAIIILIISLFILSKIILN